jgi:hypothetical protein
VKWRAPALLLAALVAWGTSACLSVSWRRDARFGRLPEGALASMEPGETDLGTCLARLGAPLEVWEVLDGMALAYGWERERNVGLTLSVPIDRGLSASLNVANERARLRGVVLFFDAADRLTVVRSGRLAELLPPRRSAAVDEPE